jgi:hypothetical protein
MMTKLIIIAGFVIAFGAGMVTGLKQTREEVASPTTQPTTRPRERGPGPGRGAPDRGSFIARELRLTDEQTKQMTEIWSDVARRSGREQELLRRQIREDRDAAIVALIRDEDRGSYDQVLADARQRLEALDKEWRDAWQQAVERTNGILNEEQRARYQAILSRNDWERGPGGPRGGPGSRGGGGGDRREGDRGGRDGDRDERNNDRGRDGDRGR